MLLLIIIAIGTQPTHHVLHPGWERWQALCQISCDGGTLILIGEDRVQPPQNAPAVVGVGERVAQPV